MDRKDFLEKTYKLGVCCGSFLAFDGRDSFCAQPDEPNSRERGELSSWVVNLLAAIDENLSYENKAAILEACGRACARRGFKTVALRYKDDLEGLLCEIKEQWADCVEFHDFDGVVRITGKKRASCNCSVVRTLGSLSGSICLCSQGWHKEIFETVTGRPVWAESEMTIIRGDERCVHAVYLS